MQIVTARMTCSGGHGGFQSLESGTHGFSRFGDPSRCLDQNDRFKRSLQGSFRSSSGSVPGQILNALIKHSDHHGNEEGFLAFEVPVENRFGDPCGTGQIPRSRCMKSIPYKLHLSGIQNGFPPCRGIQSSRRL